MTLRFWTEEAADPDDVMQNWEFIMNNMLVDGLERTTVPGFEDFFFTRFYDGSESKIDASNSTCCYASPLTTAADRGKAWFCTQYDQFDDSSFSAVNWTSTTGAGSVTESGIKVTLTVSRTDNGSTSATLTSDGSSGLDMRGQDGEVITFLRYRARDAGGATGGSPTASCKLYVGSTSTFVYTLASVAQDEDSGLVTVDMRFVFNNSAQTVDVYKDGIKVARAIDISGEVNWYIGYQVLANSGSINDIMTATIDVYTAGFVKDGDSNSVDFVTATETASATVDAMFLRIVISGGSTTLNGSANNGSNYSTLTNKKLASIATSGTGIKFKATQTVPSINSAQVNIESITELGVFYG